MIVLLDKNIEIKLIISYSVTLPTGILRVPFLSKIITVSYMECISIY